MIRRGLFFAVLSASLLAEPGCKPVPLTAPDGAELSITANPSAIPANGGLSIITVLGFKAQADGGGPLPDGTQIFFTTNVGTIEERVEMINGIAEGHLRSTGRSGVATVVARSGSGITATLGGTGEGATSGVLIGGGEGINIRLVASPPTVSEPDFSTELTATVFDNDNNRMEGIPVIFSTTAGALASQGTSLRTNENGQVFDRLTLGNEPSATVTAFSGQVASDPVTVARATVIEPIVTTIAPTSGLPGQTLNVRVNGLNFQPGAGVSFGEGISVNSVTFVSSTELRVSITIDTNIQNTSSARTVTVTNPDGGTGSLPSAFRITTLNPAPIITSLNPTQSATRGVNFNITINGLNFVAGAQVTFTPSGQVNVVTTTFNNSNQIVVTVNVDPDPPGPPAGTVFQIQVTNPDGLQSNASNFTTN